jgi:hypothetical protein
MKRLQGLEWASPLEPSYAACVATGRSPTGLKVSGKRRARFGCRREKGRYVVPSEYIIRDVLIRVAPAHLDRALRRWNEVYAGEDESLAVDGKTLCNALDEEGRPTPVMSVVGHPTQTGYTPRKWGPCP